MTDIPQLPSPIILRGEMWHIQQYEQESRVAAVLIIFVVCLIGKDVAFAPAPYVMRGAAQAICFASGSST
jgi:hypothetical protein